MKQIKFFKHTAALTLCALLSGAFLASPARGQAPAQGKYKNFRVAMYVLRGNVMKWSDSRRSRRITTR